MMAMEQELRSAMTDYSEARMTYKQFLTELRKTRTEFKWSLFRSGMIRGRNATECRFVCPITAIYKKKLYFTGQWKIVAHDLGISVRLSRLIVTAADLRYDEFVNENEKVVRRDLLKALGLKERL